MATKIVTKNSSTASAVPTASDLVQGELAVNVADKRLFTEDNGGAIVELGTNPYNFTANYNGSAKLTTTATGIDVTGTATVDGLVVDGNAVIDGGATDNTVLTLDSGTPNTYLKITDSNSTNGAFIGATTNDLNLYPNNTLSAKFSAGGDISFYEDTGTTAKFFWDASAESLGIGQGVFSGTQALNLKGEGIAIKNDKSGSNNNWSLIRNTGTSSTSNISFVTGSGEAMVLDHNMNVGIGTSSPGVKLDVISSNQVVSNFAHPSTSTATVNGGAMVRIQNTNATNGNQSSLVFADSTASASSGIFGYNTNHSTHEGYMVFGTRNSGGSFAERMRIDSSGNVGIGESSPAQKIHLRTSGVNTGARLQVAGGSGRAYDILSTTDGSLTITDANASSERMRIASNGAVLVGKTSGTAGNTIETNGRISAAAGSNAQPTFNCEGDTNTGINLPESDRIQLITGGSERMRIDSSGNVGIGATSVDTKLHLEESDATSLFLKTQNSAGALLVGNNSAGNSFVSAQTSGKPLILETENTERARIDASGNLLVGCTALPSGGAGGAGFETGQSGGRTILQLGTTVTSTEAVARFYNPNGAIGSISLSGSSTSYNTSSDQRLKENIADADDAGSKVDAIQVRKFDWKADGSHQDYGMIAQELQTVAPEAVSGDADSEEMMGVDYSKLVPMLIKEIQSLRNRVAQLEE